MILIALAAAIAFALGSAHLVYTFFGRKLRPREAGLEQEMRRVKLVISRQVSMWDGWISFNATHSMAAMLFGLVYGYLALYLPGVLRGSSFLQAVGFAHLLGFVTLGRFYWFSIPYRGSQAALALYVAGLLLSRLG